MLMVVCDPGAPDLAFLAAGPAPKGAGAGRGAPTKLGCTRCQAGRERQGTGEFSRSG